MNLNLSLTPADRIIKTSINLQREKPFFAYILMNFDLHQSSPSSCIPTMGVNKYGHLYWNKDFVKSLSNSELTYVLCHEVLHLAKGDFFRDKKRDPMIWNIASDCIINDMLNQEHMTPPKKFGLLVPDDHGEIVIGGKTYSVRDKTTEQLYDELYNNAEKIEVYIAQNGGKGQGKGKGQGQKQDDQQDKDNGHGGFDIHLKDKNDQGEDEKKDESTSTDHAAENKWKKVTVEAATIAKQRGQLPGSMESIIENILNPVVDWRQRLYAFITNEIPIDFENRLPGRRFYGTGVWCPRILRENLHLMVSVDCSGSTMDCRERFIGEVQGILQSFPQVKARIVFWDYVVDPANDIVVDTQTVDKFHKMHLKNVNGGTNLSSYTEYCEKKGYRSNLHVILTDGCIEEQPQVPAGHLLFVLCGQSTDEIVKKYGETIHIRDEKQAEYNG